MRAPPSEQANPSSSGNLRGPFDQPFVQLALGAGWLFSAFGRLVSLLTDGATFRALLYFLLEIVLAAAALAPAFGFISS